MKDEAKNEAVVPILKIKAVFVGDSAVGKSAVCKAFCSAVAGREETAGNSNSNTDSNPDDDDGSGGGGGGGDDDDVQGDDNNGDDDDEEFDGKEAGDAPAAPFTVLGRSEPIVVAGERCDVGLWDTASEEEMDRLRPLAYAEADLFVLCFSVVQPDSLESLRVKWSQELKFHSPKTPLVLLGTMTDLRPATTHRHSASHSASHSVETDRSSSSGATATEAEGRFGSRGGGVLAGSRGEKGKSVAVDAAKGQGAARSLGALAYVECSAGKKGAAGGRRRKNKGVNGDGVIDDDNNNSDVGGVQKEEAEGDDGGEGSVHEAIISSIAAVLPNVKQAIAKELEGAERERAAAKASASREVSPGEEARHGLSQLPSFERLARSSGSFRSAGDGPKDKRRGTHQNSWTGGRSVERGGSVGRGSSVSRSFCEDNDAGGGGSGSDLSGDGGRGGSASGRGEMEESDEKQKGEIGGKGGKGGGGATAEPSPQPQACCIVM